VPISGEITSDAGLAQAKKNSEYFKKLLQGTHMGMGGGMGSVREVDYKGHHITIQTTYRIKIDGKTFNGELSVSNAGSVHYHGMPNTGFASAVDLVKAVVDTFSDEFAAGSKGTGMGGMNMKMGGRRRSPAKRK
jgi:hypothetical protein